MYKRQDIYKNKNEENYLFKLEKYQDSMITTILVNTNLKTVIIGYENGNIKEFIIDIDKRKFRLLKIYDNLKIKNITNSVLIENLAFFSGNNKIISVDLIRHDIFHDPVITSIKKINSLSICKFKKENQKFYNKIYLIASGEFISDTNSDIFNLENLIKIHNVRLISQIQSYLEMKIIQILKCLMNIKKLVKKMNLK